MKVTGNAVRTQAAEAKVPTYILSADRKGDVFGLVALRRRLNGARAPQDEISAMDELLREFELYEQAHR